eukprot:scaffold17457_cov76-Attheya_sp.AAC.3
MDMEGVLTVGGSGFMSTTSAARAVGPRMLVQELEQLTSHKCVGLMHKVYWLHRGMLEGDTAYSNAAAAAAAHCDLGN